MAYPVPVPAGQRPAPPRIDASKLELPVVIREGSHDTVTLGVTGYPEPTVKWLVGRTELQTSDDYKIRVKGRSHTLRIRHAGDDLNWLGLFLVAQNYIGQQAYKVDLKVYRVLKGMRMHQRSKSQTWKPRESTVTQKRRKLRMIRGGQSLCSLGSLPDASLDTRRYKTEQDFLHESSYPGSPNDSFYVPEYSFVDVTGQNSRESSLYYNTPSSSRRFMMTSVDDVFESAPGTPSRTPKSHPRSASLPRRSHRSSGQGDSGYEDQNSRTISRMSTGSSFSQKRKEFASADTVFNGNELQHSDVMRNKNLYSTDSSGIQSGQQKDWRTFSSTDAIFKEVRSPRVPPISMEVPEYHMEESYASVPTPSPDKQMDEDPTVQSHAVTKTAVVKRSLDFDSNQTEMPEPSKKRTFETDVDSLGPPLKGLDTDVDTIMTTEKDFQFDTSSPWFLTKNTKTSHFCRDVLHGFDIGSLDNDIAEEEDKENIMDISYGTPIKPDDITTTSAPSSEKTKKRKKGTGKKKKVPTATLR